MSLIDFTSAQATLGVSNTTLTACTTGAFLIQGCTLNNLVGMVFSGPEAFDSVSIINNTLAADETAGTRTTAMFLTAPTNTPDYYVKGNTCTGWKNGISITTASEIVVADNVITITLDIGASSGHCLAFGTDSWTPDPEAAVLSTLKRKLICRNNHVTVTGDGDRHAIFVGQSYAGGSIERNYVKNDVANANFGAVIKASGVSFRGNVIHCYDSGLYLAGATGCTAADNTIIVSTEGFVLGFSATGRDPINNHIYNNILYGVASDIEVIDFGAITSTHGNDIDYNICYPERLRFNNVTYTTLAALVAAQANYVHFSGQAMHQDTTFGDPLLNLTTYKASHASAKRGGLPNAVQANDALGAIRAAGGGGTSHMGISI